VSSQNFPRTADCSISFRRAWHICVTCCSFKAFNIFFYKFSGVCLGIARGAIEDFVALAQNRAMTFKSPSAGKATLRDEAFAQQTVAQAEANGQFGTRFVFETVDDMWSTLVTGQLPSLKQHARARLAMVHASTACTQAVELLYKANGGSSVYTGNIFDRRRHPDRQSAYACIAQNLGSGGPRAAGSRTELWIPVLNSNPAVVPSGNIHRPRFRAAGIKLRPVRQEIHL
jgi:hypothetical protein